MFFFSLFPSHKKKNEIASFLAFFCNLPHPFVVAPSSAVFPAPHPQPSPHPMATASLLHVRCTSLTISRREKQLCLLTLPFSSFLSFLPSFPVLSLHLCDFSGGKIFQGIERRCAGSSTNTQRITRAS